MITKGQTLHIKYTGEKIVCKDMWPSSHRKNTFKQNIYWFECVSFPIKEEQIKSALMGKRWEII